MDSRTVYVFLSDVYCVKLQSNFPSEKPVEDNPTRFLYYFPPENSSVLYFIRSNALELTSSRSAVSTPQSNRNRTLDMKLHRQRGITIRSVAVSLEVERSMHVK